MKSKLSAQERLQYIKRSLAGEPVSKLCKEAKISRVLFYRWLKRYKKSGESGLKAKTHKIDPHIRRVKKEYERQVINLVIEHPEFGIRRLLTIIPKVSGKPVVGHHGLQNILERNNIYTYDLRFAYAISRRRLIPRFVFASIINRVRSVWESFVPTLAPAPPPRLVSLLQGKLPIDLRTLFSFIGLSLVFLFGFVYWSSIFASPYANPVGLFFATIALFTGSIFFLYSLKYYFTIAIVLSYSQKDRSVEGEVETGGGGGLFSWILGTSEKRLSKGGGSQGIGLTPDLSGITLERFPYISVQIPFYNEKNVVERALKAAVCLDYKSYEVILCDDSTDETTRIIADYIRSNAERKLIKKQSGDGWTQVSAEVKPGVILKHLHRTARSGFKGGALELARKLTSPNAEFITIFDADFVPYPDTLKLFLKYFKIQNNRSEVYTNSKVAAVQGYQWHVLNKSENWVTRGVRSEYSGSYVIERSGVEIYEGLKQIAGSVYMVRKDILDRIGWGTSITEDFELTLNLYEHGYKVLYTPYIQGPAECVSTISRLIRQRMRWAEGHSFNVKRMFTRLLFGSWEVNHLVMKPFKNGSMVKLSNGQMVNHETIQPFNNATKWIPSPLTNAEKLEFLYLSPYYLQAFFFLVGTFSWFMAEAIFPARLPFWTSLWGWSLVLTNLVALPLVNAVGLFLEESEEKDFFGILSFIALSYIVVPFQAYAAIKGFMETEEGPWFRTPKTGRITDIFSRAKFFRFLYGSLGGKPKKDVSFNFYLSLDSANSKFDSFKIRPRTLKWVGNLVLVLLISATLMLAGMAPMVPKKLASEEPRGFITLANAMESQEVTQVGNKEEITSPLIVRKEVGDNKFLEYIFHPEPRVRTKLGDKEIEIKLISTPTRAYREGKTYIYENVYKGINLRYKENAERLKEEFVLNDNNYEKFDFIEEEIKLTGLALAQIGKEIQIAPEEGGSPLFYFEKPYLFEEGNPQTKNFGIRYEIEKVNFGFKVRKVLTEEGKAWINDPERTFPIVIDPTLVKSNVIASGVVDADVNVGSPQRKIAYSSTANGGAAWYVIDDVGADIHYKRCLASSLCDQDSDWSAAQTINSDTSGNNWAPSLWHESDSAVYIAWIDDTGVNPDDVVHFRTIDTTTSFPHTLGTDCENPTDPGVVGATHYAFIAAGDNGDVVVGFETSSGTNTVTNIFEFASGADCTNAANWVSIEAGSGVDATTADIFVGLVGKGNSIHLIYEDNTDNDINHSVRDVNTNTWDSIDNDVDGADNIDEAEQFGVATDGTDIWVHAVDGTTATDFFRCSSCPDSSPTWTITDSIPFSGETNVTEVGLTYISTTPLNTLVAFAIMDNSDQAYFVTSDADTISWSCGVFSKCSLGYTAGALNHFGAPSSVADEDEVGIVLWQDDATDPYRFSTLPENLWILLFLTPILPRFFNRFRRRSAS